MSRFGQLTRLVAVAEKRDELAAKFLEAAEIHRENADCLLMLVSAAQDSADVVYVTEMWSSEAAWKEARRGRAIQNWWAKSVPALIAGQPETIPLTILGGKEPATI